MSAKPPPADGPLSGGASIHIAGPVQRPPPRSSVPLSFLTVLVREQVADAIVRGGAAALIDDLGAKREAGLLRWAAMTAGDAAEVMGKLRRRGFGPGEVALTDVRRGLLTPCEWGEVFTGPKGGKRIRLRSPGVGS